MLALTGTPRRLRLRLFFAAAQLVSTGRRRIPRLTLALDRCDHRRLTRLDAFPNPG